MERGQSDQRLQELIRYAYDNAAGWRERLDGLRIAPEEVVCEADLARIPVLRKEQLPALQRRSPPFAGLLAGQSLPARIFLSPGPIYDPQPAGDDPWRFARSLADVGFRSGDIVLNTFSYHLSPAGFMFDSALRKLQATVIPAGVGNTELFIPLLRDLAVTGYVGTPSYFLSLLKRAEQEGFRFGEEICLSKAFFTAEPLPPELPLWCEQRGINFGEAYGTADVGCIAYRVHPLAGLLVQPDVLVQICDPSTGTPLQPGEAGEVVITLFDSLYPLIRFGTGDLSRWLDESKTRLAGIVGRVGDGVKVRGMFVYQQQLDQVFARFPQVACYQANVTRMEGRDQLEIQVELTDGERTADGSGRADHSFHPSNNTANREDHPLLSQVAERIREVTRVKAVVTPVAYGKLDRTNQRFHDQRNG
ncbi:AMP-binding protein [Brevibacillus humidisoli]|uniref:phenylacetate--CoA ligase family protein n=1 Tax=Brevibacillus humidisoli TaxID=2895522 RepID=UPI001E349E51|nr:AMP-binding protein [Brevibacillus humidisoli]UFJ41598.1 AMP-binding protein [Brevibacillus humidisoli]